MAEEISENERLSLFVAIIVGVTIATLLLLSLCSRKVKLHNAWSLAYSLQMYYLLMFVNTTLPLNAESFFQGMKFFNGQIDWIRNMLNPISTAVESANVKDAPLSRHFEILGLTSSHFIINVESVLYIIACLAAFSFVSGVITRCARQSADFKKARGCERVHEASSCNFWVRIIFSFYASFAFFSFVSLSQINMSNGTFASLISFGNILSAILVLGFFAFLTLGLQGVVNKLRSG